MTREEAIAVLRREIEPSVYEDEKSIAEAIDMAIEALLGEKHQLSNGRLIDADELKKHLDGAWEELNDEGERKGVRLARWYLISAPTVDSTIEVVRCKDCRFWKNEHLCLVMSRYGSMDTKAEDFCSWGERKEE